MTISTPARRTVAARGPRARTNKLLLETAVALMEKGQAPSVSAVAETAGVSRATAYRCFPSQAALVEAVVAHALGPILSWTPEGADPAARIVNLIVSSLPRILAFEATFRTALALSLAPDGLEPTGHGDNKRFKRGHRITLIEAALAPLRKTVPDATFRRLSQATSLLFGIETVVVLRDIWEIQPEDGREMLAWATRALVGAALAEQHGHTEAASSKELNRHASMSA